MKKFFVSACLFVLIGSTVNAQEFAKVDKSVLDVAYFPARAAFRSFAKTDDEKMKLTPKIRVMYSRPVKNNRTIFGELVPFDQPWRLGANESTEIQFLVPVKFGDAVVPAGRYTLYAVPTKDTWTFKLSLDVDGWGAYAYNAKKDIASVTVPVSQVSDSIEEFSITMYEKSENVVHLKAGWDKSVAEVPIILLD